MSATLTPCREWPGARTSAGYGERKADGKTVYLHRWVWEQIHGPIPTGMQVMHRCDNPPCFRFDHLTLGTAGDNGRDAASKRRFPAQHRTHCPQGHPYDEDNTLISTDGWRRCRTCRKEQH